LQESFPSVINETIIANLMTLGQRKYSLMKKVTNNRNIYRARQDEVYLLHDFHFISKRVAVVTTRTTWFSLTQEIEQKLLSYMYQDEEVLEERNDISSWQH
jgi:uncharacterized protein YeeX (DUF496 family)